MAFMVPEYTNEPFYEVENENGESFFVPADLVGSRPKKSDFKDYIEFGKPVSFEKVKGWFFRLSAPGYMDRTEWSGPYKTLKAAKEELERMYDVDPDTGEELEENPRRKTAGKTPDQKMMLRDATVRLGEQNRVFLEMMESDHPITVAEIKTLAKKRPAVWGKYVKYVENFWKERRGNPNRGDVIGAWARGRKLKSSALRTEGGKLCSYNLLIGETIGGKLVAYDYTGSNRVSQTTTTHVNAAKAVADEIRPPRKTNPRRKKATKKRNPVSVRKLVNDALK